MDEFRELLKEAYARGCPFCGDTGEGLCATKEYVKEAKCRIRPDGNLVKLRSEIIHAGFVSRIHCLTCGKNVYINGEWV